MFLNKHAFIFQVIYTFYELLSSYHLCNVKEAEQSMTQKNLVM